MSAKAVFVLLAGFSAATALAQNPGPVVELPPVLVESNQLQLYRWRLAELRGYEVLTACPEGQSEEFVNQLRERRWELAQIVPDQYLFHAPLPMMLILVPRSFESSMRAVMGEELRRVDPSLVGSRFAPLPHLRLEDVDSTAMYVVLPDAFTPSFNFNPWNPIVRKEPNIVLAPDYFRYLMEAISPRLPQWLIVGVTDLYVGDRFQRKEMSFDPQTWLSPEVTDGLRHEPDAVHPILPLSELFSDPTRSTRPADYQRVWAAQAELFVRWALSDQVPDGRAKLWRWAQTQLRWSATEQAFEDCFGLNYADARDALSDYLGAAVQEGPHWKIPSPPHFGSVRFGDASPGEVHRIQGEWARRVLRIVSARYPRLLPAYEQRAIELLQGSYDRGGRDPRLIVSLGLLRIELGDDAAGLRLLLEAQEKGPIRPLGQQTLAQLAIVKAPAARAP